MFEGDRYCCICKSETERKVFGLTLSGCSRTFCKKCYSERKEEVSGILNEKK